jgi:OOP family OmpA-OmpF porin
VLLSFGSGKPAFAGEPVIGMELSAAVPISKFKRTADLGGAAGVYGGYHFHFSDTVGLSLLANPEFSFFPSSPPNDRANGYESDSDLVAIMGLNAGPRLTIGDEKAEFFLDGRGGYFRELSGPLNEDGPGFNAGAGVGFGIAEGTYVTLAGRYNEVFMRAQRGYVTAIKGGSSSHNLRFVTAGIGIEHRFLAPEPVEAAPPPPPPPPPPPAAPMKKKIILRGVNFDFDKSNIRADARPVLDEAIDTLKDAGDVRVSVEGHTDSVGTDAYNQGLSMRRANSVADYLAAGGISRSRMEVDGFGESRPVASNDTDDGRAQNRRVELKVIE